jgi:hypothetical protein
MEDMDISDFLRLADTSKCKNADAVIDDVHRRYEIAKGMGKKMSDKETCRKE